MEKNFIRDIQNSMERGHKNGRKNDSVTGKYV